MAEQHSDGGHAPHRLKLRIERPFGHRPLNLRTPTSAATAIATTTGIHAYSRKVRLNRRMRLLVTPALLRPDMERVKARAGGQATRFAGGAHHA
jgi:hypothetical protein